MTYISFIFLILINVNSAFCLGALCFDFLETVCGKTISVSLFFFLHKESISVIGDVSVRVRVSLEVTIPLRTMILT